MQNKEVLEGSKVLALFDGWVIEKSMEDMQDPFFSKDFDGCFLSRMKYHTSWSWLMPVVEKIENGLDEKFVIETTNSLYSREIEYVTIVYNAGNALYLDMDSEKSRLLSVYKAVIEFIKWYNNQKK